MLPYSSHLEKTGKIKSGEISLTENLKTFLKRIEDNKDLNAFNFTFEKEALEKTPEIEEKIKSGSAGKLAGMVIAVKDVLSIKDKPTTCSSNILKYFTSVYTATSVQRLIDEDAIIIGKTNCDEFAMGSSNENSAFGPALNPHDKSMVTGGSSGGSAAAVAAGLCDTALGSDTGGSIRQPASFCGVYGLKPTYGRISRYGLTAFASSFDTVGAFANSPADLALMMEVMSGRDENDATSSDKTVPEFLNDSSTQSEKIKIGIPREYFGEGLSAGVKNEIGKLINKLGKDGFGIVDITLPHTEYAIATYYILTTAEASSNLARFDGARYGHRVKDTESLTDMYKISRSEGFGAEVKRRIMLGTYVLSHGYYDEYYIKAQKVRRLIKNDFDEAFGKVDLILTPTTPTAAFKIGEKLTDPLEMYLNDIYTTSANLAGIPGINIPLGKAQDGLPVGAQFLAGQFNEPALLRIAARIEEMSK